MTEPITAEERMAFRERAKWGDPADGWDHETVLRLLDENERLTARVAELEGDREALGRALLRHSGAGDIEPDDADPLSQRMIGRLTAAAARKDRLLKRLEEQRDEQRARADQLAKELADAAPYIEPGKRAVLEAIRREYETGTCGDCACCTHAQCAEGDCPENAIGESLCPCTCY